MQNFILTLETYLCDCVSMTADSKPPKPAIKSSTLPRTSSQGKRNETFHHFQKIFLRYLTTLTNNHFEFEFKHLNVFNFNSIFNKAERDRLKPAPPMKQGSLSNQYQHLTLSPEVYNHLRGLQKKTKDLKSEVKTLRRLAQSQAIAVREDIKDTFMRIRATLLATSGSHWGQNDQERVR